jgi:hypothetical protein
MEQQSLTTLAERATSLAFSPDHPASHFNSASVVLWSAGATGVTAWLAELGGAAPRLLPQSFTRMGDVTCVSSLPGSGAVAVGDGRGRLALLGPGGAEAAAWQLPGGSVEAVCTLGGRLVASCGDGLSLVDPTTASGAAPGARALLGWTPAALAPLDPFCCLLAGRRLALHDSRAPRAALALPLPAAAASAAALGPGVAALGLANGAVLHLELRKPERVAERWRHSDGAACVAAGARGALSGGAEGAVRGDAGTLGKTGSAVEAVAAEPRLRCLAAASAGGRLLLGAEP